MNQIKIIKRTDLKLKLKQSETNAKKAISAVVKLRAGKVVENWIDEWRASKPKDSRRAFLALFGNSPAANG